MELWELYDEHRNKTGKIHERDKPMKAGDFHLVVQVWILNSANQFLISKRTPNIKGWSNMWQTTGGSAVLGDDSLTTALKETREEIGVLLVAENGKLFKSYKKKHSFGEGSAFYDVWLFKQEVDIDTVILQPEETCDATWATKNEIIDLLNKDEFIPIEAYPYLDELFEFCRV